MTPDTSKETRTVEVDPEHDGDRLDSFLAARPAGALALAAAAPDQRRPRHVDRASDCRPSTPVRAGQHFAIDIPAASRGHARSRSPAAPILYEDPDLVVLDKPAGMVVHPAAGHSERHAGQCAAAPRRRPERHRRRAAARHRAPARSRHVGCDGGGEERSRASGAVAAVSRPRGREGIRRARLGRGACRAAHRRADRPRRQATGRRCRRGRGARAAPSRASRGRRIFKRRVAAAGRDRHRAHPSDPRAPERHRTSDRRRPVYGGVHRRVAADLRPCHAARAAVPARGAARASRTPPTAAGSSSSRRCRRTSSR